jgi:hypothetical protein
MKSVDEILAYVALRIAYVYDRPLMYGYSGQGVDQLLLIYHEIWAEIKDCQDELRRIWWRTLEDEECGSANFATRYSMNHPDALDQEIAQYVVNQWRKISEWLSVPVPYEELEKKFPKSE